MGSPPDQIYVSLERNMNCAIGHCGHCQLGPAVRLQGRPGAPVARRSSRCMRVRGSDEPQRQAVARRVEVRELRRLPAHPARLRGRAARRGRSSSTSPTSSRRPAPRSTAPTTCRWSRARSPPPTTSSASSEVRAPVAVPGHDRRLRHRRRHPGAAQLRRRRGVPAHRLRHAVVHLDPRHVDADLRARRGRLRAARLPDRPAPAARGDRRLPARAPAGRRRTTASASSASRRATSA